MKKTIFVIVLIISAFLLASCGDIMSLLPGLGGVTPEAQLTAFIANLNNQNWTAIGDQIYDNGTDSSYDEAQLGTFWSELYQNESYSVDDGITAVDGIETGTKVISTKLYYTISGTTTETDDDVTFTFKVTDNVWLISKIERDGTVEPLYRKL